MEYPVLLLLNEESDYFAAHFADTPENIRFTRLRLNPWAVEENESIIAEELNKNQYSAIFITTGNILLSFSFLRQIKGLTKILLLTDDDWQFYEFSRHYGLSVDWLITTYKQNIELYTRHGFTNIIFSQWGVNTNNFKPLEINRNIDVSLIGAPHSIREELAGYLLEHDVPLVLFGRGWENTNYRRHWRGHLSNDDYIKSINRSKINITTMRAGDNSTLQIKGRIFEVAACRAFQLVEYNPELEEYYNPGEEIIFYNDYHDLKDKIDYYLKHETERYQIAEMAYRKTLLEHSWLKRLSGIFNVVEKKPKMESFLPLQQENVCVVFIIRQDELLVEKSLSSVLSQLCKNIKIAVVGNTPLKKIGAVMPIEFYPGVEELLNSSDYEYITFIENGDIWTEEKILIQSEALKHDIYDNIEISLSNYYLYENPAETKICYYSFSEGRRKKANSGHYVIPPSSIMISRSAALRYKDWIAKMFQTGLFLFENETLEYNMNYRVINMQQSHVLVPLKRMKKRLGKLAESGVEIADFWHWAESGRFALKFYLSRLNLVSAYKILSAKILSKKIIQNILKGG